MLPKYLLHASWCHRITGSGSCKDYLITLSSPFTCGETETQRSKGLIRSRLPRVCQGDLSAPSTKPHFLMMMKRIMVRTPRGAVEARIFWGCRRPTPSSSAFHRYIWSKNQLCSGYPDSSRVSLKLLHGHHVLVSQVKANIIKRSSCHSPGGAGEGAGLGRAGDGRGCF